MKNFFKIDTVYNHRMYHNDKVLKVEAINDLIEDDEKKLRALQLRYDEVKRRIFEINVECEGLFNRIEQLSLQVMKNQPNQNSGLKKKFSTRRALRCLDDVTNRKTYKPLVMVSEDIPILMKSFKSSLFMANFSEKLLQMIVKEMGRTEFIAGQCIIKEGAIGRVFYVIKAGECIVTKEDPQWTPVYLRPGSIFGDLAIIYSTLRVASVTAVTDVKLWFLSKKMFTECVKSHDEECINEKIGFIKELPFFETLSEENIKILAKCMTEKTYERSQKILKEGDLARHWYIIKNGRVNVMKSDGKKKTFVSTLTQGDYFGEQALKSDGIQSTSIVVESKTFTCYELSTNLVLYMLGNLEDINGQSRRATCRKTEEIENTKEKLYKLEDMKKIQLLGKGSFGKVYLVSFGDSDTYALKAVKKSRYKRKNDRKVLFNEKDMLFAVNHTFIVKLYHTFRDSRNLYFLMQPLLGGELTGYLHHCRKFNHKTASFFVACMVLALEYLSYKHILDRDLKPENVMMDSRGYGILVDFGLAINLPPGGKAYTICGTPIYMSPEMINFQGYDGSRELWALGIFVYELVTGSHPYPPCESLMEFLPYLRKGTDHFKFSMFMGKHTCDIIKGLCRFNAYERLGSGLNGFDEIKKHRWFSSFNWDMLENRQYFMNFGWKHQQQKFTSIDLENSDEEEDLSDWDLAF